MKKIILSSSIVLSLVIGLSCFSQFVLPVFSDTNRDNNSLYQNLLAEKGFIYGANIPFFIGDQTLGLGGNTVNELQGKERSSQNAIDFYKRAFINCKAIGYDAVRIWLFQNLNGIVVTDYGDIVGFDNFFLDEFQQIMNIASDLKLAVDVTLIPHLDGVYDKYGPEMYAKLTQFIVNPKYRQHFRDRIVRPLCQLLHEKYRDAILSVTVYCEPEGDTYGEGSQVAKNFLSGTSWSNMIQCINQISSTVKYYLPGIPVTATSGWNPWKTYRFNDLNVDIIGVDVYKDDGSVPSPNAVNVQKPMWLTEFGADQQKQNHSDSFQQNLMMNFYDHAINSGYKGAFYWAFCGYPPESITYTSLGFSELRPAATALHYRLIDESNKRNGSATELTADKPALLYSDDPLTLRWIASRNAVQYQIQISSDHQHWKQIADLTDVAKQTNDAGICSFRIDPLTTPSEFRYRVVVHTSEGISSVSDSLQCIIPEIYVSKENNLIQNGDFETGDFSCWNAGNGFENVLLNENERCALIPGLKDGKWSSLSQQVSLKGGQKYRITFYSKHLWDKYTYNFKVVGCDSSIIYLQRKIAIGNDFVPNTYTFEMQRQPEKVKIIFVDNYEPIYIDNVQLFAIS